MGNQLFASLAPSFDSANGTQTSNHSNVQILCDISSVKKIIIIKIFCKSILFYSKSILIWSKSILLCSKTILLCSKTILLCSKTILFYSKTILLCSKTILFYSKTILLCSKTILFYSSFILNYSAFRDHTPIENCFCSFIYLFKHKSNWMIQK